MSYTVTDLLNFYIWLNILRSLKPSKDIGVTHEDGLTET